MAAMVRMTEEDLEALRAAAATLEHPGLAARLGTIAGKPIELVGRALPESASKAVGALERRRWLHSVGHGDPHPGRDRRRTAAAVCGNDGGKGRTRPHHGA